MAALLNAANPDIDYPMSEADIIASVQVAIADGASAIQALGTKLDGYNNLGSSIDQHWTP